MRICCVTGIFPPEIGGPATYVNRIAHTLHQQQNEISVVTLGDEEIDCPFPVKRISRKSPLPFRLLVLFWVMLRMFRLCDVVYINGLELPAVLAGKLLRKRMIMKVVSDYAWERAGNQQLTTDSVLEFQTKKQHWKVEWHKRLRAWLVKQVECVITPSRHVKNLVCGWGLAESRVRVVYNAIEPLPQPLDSQQVVREQLGLSSSAHYLITIGRLIPLKGIDMIIRVVAELVQRSDNKQNLALIIVGDGPEKEYLTTLCQELKVKEHVLFTGQISRARVLAYLRAADLFVLNSSTEGLSHVILEAMLVGTPVVATAVGGNPELIEHNINGLLMPYGDSRALKTQIQQGLFDQALRETLRIGAKRIVERFTWDRLICQTLTILSGARNAEMAANTEASPGK